MDRDLSLMSKSVKLLIETLKKFTNLINPLKFNEII